MKQYGNQSFMEQWGEPPFWESIEPYQRNIAMAKYEEILDLAKENRDDIKDIKENHLIAIYKSLWQIKGTLIVLIPLTIAILTLVIMVLRNGA
ncbi:hypothetical protein ES703_108121 [subsurface metagenome]